MLSWKLGILADELRRCEQRTILPTQLLKHSALHGEHNDTSLILYFVSHIQGDSQS
jgi:hypothetical protein